jgi:hypothetical protein
MEMIPRLAGLLTQLLTPPGESTPATHAALDAAELLLACVLGRRGGERELGRASWAGPLLSCLVRAPLGRE